jgi:hypothetical protein
VVSCPCRLSLTPLCLRMAASMRASCHPCLFVAHPFESDADHDDVQARCCLCSCSTRSTSTPRWRLPSLRDAPLRHGILSLKIPSSTASAPCLTFCAGLILSGLRVLRHVTSAGCPGACRQVVDALIYTCRSEPTLCCWYAARLTLGDCRHRLDHGRGVLRLEQLHSFCRPTQVGWRSYPGGLNALPGHLHGSAGCFFLFRDVLLPCAWLLRGACSLFWRCAGLSVVSSFRAALLFLR